MLITGGTQCTGDETACLLGMRGRNMKMQPLKQLKQQADFKLVFVMFYVKVNVKCKQLFALSVSSVDRVFKPVGC